MLFSLLLSLLVLTLGMDPAKMLDQAVYLYRQRKIPEALLVVTDLLRMDPNHAHATNFHGVLLHEMSRLTDAAAQYRRSAQLLPTYEGAWSNLGLVQRQLGLYEQSWKSFETALSLQPTSAAAQNGYGLALHYNGRTADAIPYYNKALELQPTFAEAVYNRGVSEMRIGDHQRAASSFYQAIEMQPDYVESMINLASIHHQHASMEMARKYYTMALSCPRVTLRDQIMAHTNLGVTYQMDYDGKLALNHFSSARSLIFALMEEERNKPEFNAVQSLAVHRRELAENLAHMLRVRTAMCDWELYEHRLAVVYSACNHQMSQPGGISVLLPFDTLLLPVHPSWVLRVAKSYSAQWEADDLYPMQNPWPSAPGSSLRIGYLSNDFNDHPTAHMVEGLLVHHDRSRFHVVAYSYGKHDKSVFRHRIENEVDSFVDMAAWKYTASANKIASDGIHIVYDLQCHTRANRVEIAAVKPAPIFVNFLIYPGAMGARWLDYLVADSTVAPPENSYFYQSKLVLLPLTYQVNYYPRDDYLETMPTLEATDGDQQRIVRASADPRFESAAELDSASPPPPSSASFVFCNFNKNDKLDPQSFSVWMNILRRVPGSVLWLLAPSRAKGHDAITRRLKDEAAARGVRPDRIVFAPRRTKRIHLNRFKHAHLFLDSFVYGAHSTATDALRGGLPVLTLQRLNFASRVASSLALNVGTPELIAHSIREFEEIAVWFSRHRGHLASLRDRLMPSGILQPYRHLSRSSQDAGSLLRADGRLPLFNIQLYTKMFERSARCMHEVAAQQRGSSKQPLHLVVGTGNLGLKRTMRSRVWSYINDDETESVSVSDTKGKNLRKEVSYGHVTLLTV